MMTSQINKIDNWDDNDTSIPIEDEIAKNAKVTELLSHELEYVKHKMANDLMNGMGTEIKTHLNEPIKLPITMRIKNKIMLFFKLLRDTI